MENLLYIIIFLGIAYIFRVLLIPAGFHILPHDSSETGFNNEKA